MSDLYARRGVSSQKEDVHAAIRHQDKGLFPDAFCKILPDYCGQDESYACIMHADTAGTKSIMAYLYWKETGDLSVWKGIAQDALVMNIDDMVCAGSGKRFMISSTIARNKHLISADVLEALIQGCDELLSEWRQAGLEMHMAGGETADVGDLVRTIDVGYTAYARFPRKQVIRIQPRAGDVIVGFASYGQSTYETTYNSGIGCNGLTSARHDLLHHSYLHKYPESLDPGLPESICYVGPYQLTDRIGDYEVGKLILSPTRTYAPLVIQIQEQFPEAIHGLVHCTGGGQTKCLKFLPDGLQLVKDALPEPPLIFQKIQEASQLSYREMYQVYNMGCRLEAYCPPGDADKLISLAQQWGIDAWVIGRVEASDNRQLILHTPDGVHHFQ